MQKKTMGMMVSLTIAAAAMALIPFVTKGNAVQAENSIKAEQATKAEQIVNSQETQECTVENGKVSETFGHMIAKHLKNPSLQLDIEKIIKGMRDEVAGLPSPMSEEEYQCAIASIQENIFNKISEMNLNEANNFLEKNSSQEGIICLEPKLQYEILKQGEGSEITADSTPLVHYKGTLLDGTVFGNSYEQDDPIPLPLGHTIPGFSKGLVGMKEGEKRRLFIHPELAYGVAGQLPPNSLLIFEVEVLKNEFAPVQAQEEVAMTSEEATTTSVE